MDTDIFNKYKAEIDAELTINEFEVKDIQLKLPSIKHKWVARLIQTKIELSKLKQLKTEAIATLVENIKRDAVVVLSERALRIEAEKNETVVKIDEKIELNELVIDYLERVEKICNSTTFDIKNLIEIKKLELS